MNRSSRIVTGAHYGLKDWLVQRITAVSMVAYLAFLATVIWLDAPRDHVAWSAIFQNGWMRIATFLFFAGLFWHAWIGVRNVLMDYVKPTAVRLTVQTLVIISLLVYLVWTAEILWG